VTFFVVMPQGTIRLKKLRSVFTLRAKPWEVTEREMWTPMAASLASGWAFVGGLPADSFVPRLQERFCEALFPT
jgi:hypothetical protein